METKNVIPCRDVSEKHLYQRPRSYKGFTLVELIVVITILAILGTISFIQLQGFSGSARDSARIENMVNLHKGLSLFNVTSGVYPMPEGPVTISASGTDIGYQGFAKDMVGSIAKLSKWATQDPSDATIYTTYSVNANRTKMQLMSFLEDESNITAFVPNAYASAGSDYSKRSPSVRGDTLGIVLGNSGSDLNRPFQEYYDPITFTGIDIVNYTGAVGTNSSYGNIKVVTSNTETLVGTGQQIKWLEMNYRGVIELVMNGCPSGWSPSNKTIKVGTASLYFSSTTTIAATICNAPISSIIPSGTELVASICPNWWTVSGDMLKVGLSSTTIGGISTAVCIAPGNITIPSGTEVAMSACPSGWTSSNKAIKGGATLVKFWGVIGSVCIAP